MSTDFELTEAELDVIRKFVGLLNDPGVLRHLTLVVADRFGDGETPAKAVGYAIRNLNDTCEFQDGTVNAPQGVVDAAPSLALVVKCAGRVSEVSLFQFPDDFLPSSQLVEKCLVQFFVNARKRVGKTSGED